MKNFLLKTRFHTALLVGRVLFGAFIIIGHGWPKLSAFDERLHTFADPIGWGGEVSFILVVFAEVFCGLAVIFGLFTRLAAVPLIIAMAVAAFIANAGKPFGGMEMALLYLAAFVALFLTGPGKYSLDYLIFKRR